jgi:hypothetical protein
MTNSQVHPQGWISLLIAPKYEELAKQMRAERDCQYGNIYAEAVTDERWVGDLGEMVFNSWFKHEKIKGYEWVLDDAAGAPDFVTALNIRIGVKTVKRKVPPREGYTAQITARHAEEPIDQFFFMTYEIDKRRMWLLGGIDRDRFLKEARYYEAGEWVHPKYQIRQGHEIYNIEIAKLIRPKFWLEQVAFENDLPN